MKLLVLILLGAALTIGGLWAGWRLAPITTHATDATAIMAAAVDSEVRLVSQESEVVYVDPPEVASTLRIGAQLRVQPWGRRPEDLGCAPPGGGRIVMAPCARNDYVQAFIQAIPFWRLALVQVSTHNSSHEKLVIKIGSEWVVVGTRGYVI